MRLRSCLGPLGGPARIFLRDDCFASVHKVGPFLWRKRIYIADVGNLSAEPPSSGSIDHNQKIAARGFYMGKHGACNGRQYGGESNKIELDAEATPTDAVIMVAARARLNSTHLRLTAIFLFVVALGK